jgi:hypothetical protein
MAVKGKTEIKTLVSADIRYLVVTNGADIKQLGKPCARKSRKMANEKSNARTGMPVTCLW